MPNFAKTAINFTVQAIILAFMCLSTIAWMFPAMLSTAASMTGLGQLEGIIDSLDIVFLAIAGGVWVLAQVNMIALIVKNHGDFHVNTKNYESDWLIVFYPIMKTFYIGVALCIATIPGFIVGALTNYIFNESVAIYSFLLCTAVAVLSGILYIYSTRNDPNPWDPEYKNWLQQKHNKQKQSDA